MKIKREHKTGIIVLLALSAAIWGFNYLKGVDLFSNYNTFYAVTDNVEGVIASTPVTLKGIEIGNVEGLRFYDEMRQTMMIIRINDKYQFSKDSKIKVYGGNIMGGKSIAIVPGNDSQPATDKDTLQILKEPGMLELVNNRLTPLQDKVENALIETNKLLNGLNNVLNPKVQQSIVNSTLNLEKTLQNFNQASSEVNQLLAKNQEHFNKSFENIDKASANFVSLSDSLKQINIGNVVADLNKTIDKINISIDKLNRGEGTMAKMMNDKELYENLSKSTKELELLLKDIRNNPKRYVHFSVWGRKDKKDEK
jgi:phospholipid/cholesterol/gamma-HCH transport system substrate-binding protein